MERQLNREKEKAKNTLEDKESYLQSEIDHLKKKLREAEKEKNLLMVSRIHFYMQLRNAIVATIEDGECHNLMCKVLKCSENNA